LEIGHLDSQPLDRARDGVSGGRIRDRRIRHEAARRLLKYILELLLPGPKAEQILTKPDLFPEFFRVQQSCDTKELKKARMLFALWLLICQVTPEPLFAIHVAEEHPPAQLGPGRAGIRVSLGEVHRGDG
jgi:hypothetical protein